MTTYKELCKGAQDRMNLISALLVADTAASAESFLVRLGKGIIQRALLVELAADSFDMYLYCK